jgi:hypothetical protein
VLGSKEGAKTAWARALELVSLSPCPRRVRAELEVLVTDFVSDRLFDGVGPNKLAGQPSDGVGTSQRVQGSSKLGRR